MQLKTEGKGNGIKTNIMNLNEVAKSLRVPIECTKKYIIFFEKNLKIL